MTTPIEISIPTTTLSSPPNSKPYTLYNITLRLPLRTFIVQKRYSDFQSLHSALTTANKQPPPHALPGKTWFKTTANNPALTEQRRKDLEAYLNAINGSKDRGWRDTTAWRTFLNLPHNSQTAGLAGGTAASLHAGITGIKGELMGEKEWLDVLRECKSQLHDARLCLGKRDAAATAKGQFEAGMDAKKCLVKASSLIKELEEALKINASDKGPWGSGVGQGEMRRRKDLLASARVERDGLEKLAASLAVKNQSEASTAGGVGAATTKDKSALFGPNVSRPSGRVLGAPIPETKKTRELDNEGVLMLQKQMMQDQDLDVSELAKIVRRQREMGVAINEELVIQNEMLGRLDEDVDRVKGKIDIARKRADKIR